jgi:hypothetical protein
VLKHNWKLADRCSKIDQIFLMQSKVNEVVGKLHEGSSGQLSIKKTLDTVGLPILPTRQT